ncbi:MAG: OmpA family protein [Bryobacteraceae bacterium]
MIKTLGAIGVIGVFSSSLFAQGLTTNQTKDQWEEINFEFNSSILSDGYPSLLRLADILSQHRDYQVKVRGNTDYVGSAPYNDRLALRRAETVRDFLVKYGAAASQISVAGDGKRDPEVSNKSKEGRFMNRRVVLTVTDGQGKVVADGGTHEVMPTLADLMKKQEECCSNILKRLDKLDDILAALRDLKGENDRLKGQVAELQNAEKALEDKVNGLPKPLSAEQTTEIAKKEGLETLDEAQRRNKKFSILGLNVGPTVGNRPSGDVTFSGRGQFFSPFGGDGTHAVQAQGEYMYYPGRQEGQFDIGLVNRWNHIQAGLFSSFKYIRFREYENGGSMGQGAFLLDYVFSRGKVGFYGTEGFKNTGWLTRTQLGPTSYLETYARPMNQVGGTFQLGVWGDAWIQGNLGYIHGHLPGNENHAGGEAKLVQPISRDLAFTVAAGLNPTLVTTKNNGQVVFGLEFGNFMRPKDYMTFNHPVPMDVPRIRYELLTRQSGHSAPVADAGPNQVGVAPGTITLNGTGSYSPDHEALNYSWTQTSGPNVAISGANTATATFTAAPGTTYAFRLTVTGQSSGLQSSANTTVSTQSGVRVVRFSATPDQITVGQKSIIAWNVPNATSVSITPGIGSNLNPAGTATVSPTQTTTYTLTATGPGGQNVTGTVTITVGPSNVSVVRFEAAPTTISSGQSSTLSWSTTGAKSVNITGVGTNLPPNGSQTVSPTSSTTYTLTATGADGTTTVNAAVTVTVTTVAPPVQILSFSSDPAFSPVSGSAVVLSWTTQNATSVVITGTGVPGGTLPGNGSITVYPTTNTDYTLTAYGSGGPVSVVIHVFVR